MRRMLATARFTHSFFRPAAKLRLPSGGSLFHVKHGTRKCWDLVFGGMTWLARVPTGLFVEARELPKADAPTGGSGLHRFGSLGVGAKRPPLRLARGAVAGSRHRGRVPGPFRKTSLTVALPATLRSAAKRRWWRILARGSVAGKRMIGRCSASPDGRRRIRRRAG